MALSIIWIELGARSVDISTRVETEVGILPESGNSVETQRKLCLVSGLYVPGTRICSIGAFNLLDEDP